MDHRFDGPIKILRPAVIQNATAGVLPWGGLKEFY
jgi:hypothetical protein